MFVLNLENTIDLKRKAFELNMRLLKSTMEGLKENLKGKLTMKQGAITRIAALG